MLTTIEGSLIVVFETIVDTTHIAIDNTEATTETTTTQEQEPRPGLTITTITTTHLPTTAKAITKDHQQTQTTKHIVAPLLVDPPLKKQTLEQNQEEDNLYEL